MQEAGYSTYVACENGSWFSENSMRTVRGGLDKDWNYPLKSKEFDDLLFYGK